MRHLWSVPIKPHRAHFLLGLALCRVSSQPQEAGCGLLGHAGGWGGGGGGRERRCLQSFPTTTPTRCSGCIFHTNLILLQMERKQ